MEETISLKEIFEVLKKRVWLIIAFIVGAALIAGVVSYFVLTPTYESSSQFIVNQGEPEEDAGKFDVSDIQTNVELINTYNVIIKSNAILEDVAESLDSDYSAEQLQDKVDVSSEEDSQVVTVTATDESPELAVDIANTTVETFKEKIPDIMNVDNVSVLTEAVLDDDPSPVAPNPMLNIAIAVVLGAMVGIGLSFLLEYLDNTIKDEDDIANKLEVPVLGVISHLDLDDIPEEQQRSRTGGGAGGKKQKTV